MIRHECATVLAVARKASGWDGPVWLTSSCAGLTRASTTFLSPAKTWMLATSASMTAQQDRWVIEGACSSRPGDRDSEARQALGPGATRAELSELSAARVDDPAVSRWRACA